MEDLFKYKDRHGFVVGFAKKERTQKFIDTWVADVSRIVVEKGWSPDLPEKVIHHRADTKEFWFFIYPEKSSLQSGEIYQKMNNTIHNQMGLYFLTLWEDFYLDIWRI